jgi:hypothetical protein
MSALSTRRSRVLAVAFLLATLFGLCVWFGSYGVAPALGAYPTEQVVGPTPDQYVGGPVTLAGPVVDTDPVTMRITYRGTEARTLTITDVETPVEPGDELRVFGTLVDEDTVAATTAFAVPPAGYLYTYVVSFVSGLWVLTRLATHWRLDAGALVRRTESLTLDGVRMRLGVGGSNDDA